MAIRGHVGFRGCNILKSHQDESHVFFLSVLFSVSSFSIKKQKDQPNPSPQDFDVQQISTRIFCETSILPVLLTSRGLGGDHVRKIREKNKTRGTKRKTSADPPRYDEMIIIQVNDHLSGRSS